MTGRAYEADTAQFALWNRKKLRRPAGSKRILVADADESVCESLVELLSLKGFAAQRALHVAAVRGLLETWDPQVLFIDTRIGGCGNGAFARELCECEQARKRLLIAMSNVLPQEPVDLLKQAGYDGHCRRPCPMWRMADVLDSYFAGDCR
jgi:DNA-binding NtrC family response regulator